MNGSVRFAGDRIWAIVPIKDLNFAKQRLARAYGPAFRRDLAAAMAEDVLTTLTTVPELAGVAVVTSDPSIAELAVRLRITLVPDPDGAGHTSTVQRGIAALGEGADGVLVLPGDIPALRAEEVSCLVRHHRGGRAFTIAPAHDRRGSNGIVMTPPDAVPLAFGNDSFEPHLATSRSRGIEPTIVVLDGFGMDVDEPEDLDRVAAHLRDGATRRFLAAAGFPGFDVLRGAA